MGRMGRLAWLVVLPLAMISLAAGAFATFASAGGPPPAERSAHLLVVPTTAQGRAALSVSAARTMADHNTFTLVEASGADVDRLLRPARPCATTCARSRIGAVTRPRGRPPALLDKAGAARRSAGTGGDGLAVVQYVGPIKDAWTAAVRRPGVEVVQLHGAERPARPRRRRGARPRSRSCPERRAFVRAVTPYTAADKQRRGSRRAGHDGGRPSRPSPATAGAGARARLSRRVRQRLRGRVPVAGFASTRDARRARLDALAALGGVVGDRALGRAASCSTSVRRRSSPATARRRLRPVLGTGLPRFLNGQGFTNTLPGRHRHHRRGHRQGRRPGPRRSHPDFYRTATPRNPSRIVYAQEATRPTRTRGTAAATAPTSPRSPPATTRGTGAAVEDAQGFNYGLGIAPRAQARRDEDLQLRRRLRRHDVDHGAARRGLRHRRAHLQQLLGRQRRRRLQRRGAGVRRARPRRAAGRRRQPADHEGGLGRQLGRGRRTRSARPARPRT